MSICAWIRRVRVKYTRLKFSFRCETRANQKKIEWSQIAKEQALFNSTICIFIIIFLLLGFTSYEFNEKFAAEPHEYSDIPLRMRIFNNNNNKPMDIFSALNAQTRKKIMLWNCIETSASTISTPYGHRSHFHWLWKINMCRFRIHAFVIYLTWGHFLLSASSKPLLNMSVGAPFSAIVIPRMVFKLNIMRMCKKGRSRQTSLFRA